MRTLSYRVDFKHWLPTLHFRARIELTNWLLTSVRGKDLPNRKFACGAPISPVHGSINYRIHENSH